MSISVSPKEKPPCGTDFGNNSDGSETTADTGSGLKNSKFRLIGSGECKNEFFKLCLPEFEVFIMNFDHFGLTSLFRRDISINGITEFRKFHFQTFENKRFKVKGSICGIYQNLIQYHLSRFTEGVRDNVSQLDIGNCETVLQTILFA